MVATENKDSVFRLGEQRILFPSPYSIMLLSSLFFPDLKYLHLLHHRLCCLRFQLLYHSGLLIIRRFELSLGSLFGGVGLVAVVVENDCGVGVGVGLVAVVVGGDIFSFTKFD